MIILSFFQKIQSINTTTLTRLILIVGAVLGVLLVAFGGYYYWDRYTFVGDQSPIERDIEHMESVIREDPQNPDARVALAEFYLSKGSYQEAQDQANQVLSLHPDHEAALLVAGIAAIRSKKPGDALDPLEKFVAARKDLPTANSDTTLQTAYYFLGESYMALNRPVEAIDALEGALLINRADADALYQLGLAYQANNQPETALEKYHRAVQFVPDFSEAYQAMAESYAALNQIDHVTYANGMYALSTQDYQTAQQDLLAATQALPDFSPAFEGLGMAYEKLNNLDQAKIAAEQAISLDPHSFAAQQLLGRIMAIQGPVETQ